MKIVFFGTPEFAVASLDILVSNGNDVAAVVTAPDKPSGRGMALSRSSVKDYALAKGLEVLQPENLRDENFIARLKAIQAGLHIVVAFRMLPEIVWKMPQLGTFNLHASLLPQYRGAAPVNRVIMNGERETGITTFFLQKEIDTGMIIFREKVLIREDETAGELHDELMTRGAGLVLKTVQAIENGGVKMVDQSEFFQTESELKKAPKISKDDCRIDWKKTVDEIFNQVRGLSPYPAAFTGFRTESGELSIKVFISEREKVPDPGEPGKIISDGRTFLKISCRDGFLMLKEIQQAGKKRMKIDEFLRGFRLNQYTGTV